MFKVYNTDTRIRCEICPKLTIKTRHSRSGVFIVNFKHILHLVLVFLSLTLSRKVSVGKVFIAFTRSFEILRRKVIRVFCVAFNFMEILRPTRLTSCVRGRVFRTISNICVGVFLQNKLTTKNQWLFLLKNFIIDLRQGRKCTSGVSIQCSKPCWNTCSDTCLIFRVLQS